MVVLQYLNSLKRQKCRFYMANESSEGSQDYLNRGRAFALACLKVYEERTRPQSLDYSFDFFLRELRGDLAEHYFKNHSFNLIRALEQVKVKGMAHPKSLRVREKPLYACAEIVLEDRMGYVELGKKVEKLFERFCPKRESSAV
jgi:hypothetical protein